MTKTCIQNNCALVMKMKIDLPYLDFVRLGYRYQIKIETRYETLSFIHLILDVKAVEVRKNKIWYPAVNLQ